MPIRLPIAAIAAFFALTGPALALETTRTDYKVTIEGSLDYNRADVDGDASVQHDEAVDFHTEIPKYSFYDHAAEVPRGAYSTASLTRGSYVLSGPSGSYPCGSHTLTDSTGGALEAQPHADRTVFTARVIDSFTIQVGGCAVEALNWDYQFTSGGQPAGIGLFDGSFTLPHDQIGAGQLTFPLHGAVTGSECPNAHFNTALCSLTWDAVVTFTRTAQVTEELEEPDLVPITPDPTPAPDAEDDLLVPLVAKASLSSRTATLPFTCAVACSGTLTATAKGRTLAKRAVAAAAGATTTAKLRFDKRDRRAIRKAGGVRLTLRLIAGGQAITETVRLGR